MAVDTFTTPGATTWTCPLGVTTIKIECWGGGGGGDVGAGATHGGGGAGGMYSRVDVFTVTNGIDYNLVVAAGGAVATVGDDSTFNTSTCIAKGGAPANGSTGGSNGGGPAGTGDQKYDGGFGADGVGLNSGGGGGAGGDTAAGSNASGVTGGAGGVNGGGAGNDGDLGGGVGNTPGGGGGGDTVTASVGGDGQVKITYNVVIRRSWGGGAATHETSIITGY